MSDVLTYIVLGAEGESVEINGVSHAVGAEIELTSEEANAALAEGKVEVKAEEDANPDTAEEATS